VVAHMSLSEKIYRDLKSKIINLEFEPGEPLSADQLSKVFKASRTPIKEAINQLTQEGLIKNFKHKGAFVNTLSIKEMSDISQIRSVLEPFSIRLAINNIREKELKEFENRFINLKKVIKDGSFNEAHEKELNGLIMEFHRLIHKATRNDLLFRFMDNLYARIEMTKNYLSRSLNKVKDENHAVISNHLKIIQALGQRDAEMAEKQMHKHINDAMERISNLF
jgi:DNA-binding GntR family transcriptional regulator